MHGFSLFHHYFTLNALDKIDCLLARHLLFDIISSAQSFPLNRTTAVFNGLKVILISVLFQSV